MTLTHQSTALIICPPQGLNIISSQQQTRATAEKSGQSLKCRRGEERGVLKQCWLQRNVWARSRREKIGKVWNVVLKLKGTFELMQSSPFPETWGHGAQRGALGAFLLFFYASWMLAEDRLPNPGLRGRGTKQPCPPGLSTPAVTLRNKPKLGWFIFVLILICFFPKSPPPPPHSIPDMNQYWFSG